MQLNYYVEYHRPDKTEPRSVGFYSSRSAAEAAIANMQWRPEFRDYRSGFTIEEYKLDKVLRFTNLTTRSLDVVVEPWATEEAVAPGSTFAVHYSTPRERDDTSRTEIGDDTITFQCDGDTFALEIDGVIVHE